MSGDTTPASLRWRHFASIQSQWLVTLLPRVSKQQGGICMFSSNVQHLHAPRAEQCTCPFSVATASCSTLDIFQSFIKSTVLIPSGEGLAYFVILPIMIPFIKLLAGAQSGIKQQASACGFTGVPLSVCPSLVHRSRVSLHRSATLPKVSGNASLSRFP